MAPSFPHSGMAGVARSRSLPTPAALPRESRRSETTTVSLIDPVREPGCRVTTTSRLERLCSKSVYAVQPRYVNCWHIMALAL